MTREQLRITTDYLRRWIKSENIQKAFSLLYTTAKSRKQKQMP